MIYEVEALSVFEQWASFDVEAESPEEARDRLREWLNDHAIDDLDDPVEGIERTSKADTEWVRDDILGALARGDGE